VAEAGPARRCCAAATHGGCAGRSTLSPGGGVGRLELKEHALEVSPSGFLFLRGRRTCRRPESPLREVEGGSGSEEVAALPLGARRARAAEDGRHSVLGF